MILYLLLLVHSPASWAQEAVARACLSPELTLSIARYEGQDGAAREARRLQRGESTDAAKADDILAGRAVIRTAADGTSVLTWRRGRGSDGVDDCIRRLQRLAARFPGPAVGGAAEGPLGRSGRTRRCELIPGDPRDLRTADCRTLDRDACRAQGRAGH